MIQFSTNNHNIMVFIGKPPDIWEHYVKHAEFIDDRGLKNNGTEVYVIISNGFALKYSIIAFRSDPIGYAGFTPGLHYEHYIVGLPADNGRWPTD